MTAQTHDVSASWGLRDAPLTLVGVSAFGREVAPGWQWSVTTGPRAKGTELAIDALRSVIDA